MSAWMLNVKPGGNGALEGTNQNKTIRSSGTADKRKFKLNHKGVKFGRFPIWNVWDVGIETNKQ